MRQLDFVRWSLSCYFSGEKVKFVSDNSSDSEKSPQNLCLKLHLTLGIVCLVCEHLSSSCRILLHLKP